jgi:hypothetical protein
MDSIRNLIKNDYSPLSININNSEASKQEINRSNSSNRNLPTENDEDNAENDDCFIKFGLVSSSEEENDRNQKQNTSKTQIEEDENEQDQPAHLAEEINAIISLIIYDTYSKKHEYTFSSQHRVS